jgi:regulator of sirC expression with transglutaminase-like and TPR domain
MNEPDSSGTRVEHFRREFTRLVARPEEDLDLGLAALLIAGEEYPDLDVREHLDRLESFAATVNERAPETLSSEQRASGLASYLFGDLGFRGNSSDYYSPDNSYFNRVLETRTGIPITLSLLFIEVGRRMGMRAYGVGMPGHFLVGLEGAGVYFDPFNGGGPLSAEDCRGLASNLFGPRMTWDDRYLDPCTKYEFLFRILNNLKVVYERTDAPEKALGVVQRMLMVRPDATALYQDLASLQQHLHQYRAAISSLESYLKERGDATDAPQVKSWIDSLKVTLSRLN